MRRLEREAPAELSVDPQIAQIFADRRCFFESAQSVKSADQFF
jgi:hypothetical protein